MGKAFVTPAGPTEKILKIFVSKFFPQRVFEFCFHTVQVAPGKVCRCLGSIDDSHSLKATLRQGCFETRLADKIEVKASFF